MYYSAIGLLAVFVLIIVNRDILFHSDDSFKKPAWKKYRRFLLTVLTYYITDIIWGVFEYLKMPKSLFADTTVYFIAMSAGVLFWAEFAVIYLEERNRNGKALIFASRIVAGLITVLVIVNIFKPVLFTVDKKCVYEALPFRYVMLVCQILLLLNISVYSLATMIRNVKSADKRNRYRTLAAFGFIMAACLFAQLWFPYLPLYSIAYMLGTCLLHSFVAIDEKEEHKRSREEAEKINELKDRFKSLLDNMPGMTFTKDVETGVYIFCNQGFADYAHKDSPDEVAGLTDAEIFDAETAKHFAEDDKIAISLSKPYVFFEDVPDAAGNHRQLQTTKLKYTDTSGRLCVLGMCQDVTEMVSIQHEQAMTKEAYEKAVSAGLMYSRIAQILARDFMDMYYVNTDTEEYIEYQINEEDHSFSEVRRGWHFFSDCRNELAGKVFEEDRNAFLQAMKRKELMKALERKDTFVMTTRIVKENCPYYVTIKISRMEDEQYIIMGITDVDAEIHETMAKNKVLAEALDATEEASRAKTAFLSGMSHELRTPMNAIIGLNALALKNKDLTPETRDYLGKIGNSSKHLLGIINNILDMSRIESGRMLMHKEEFSLFALLEQINTMVLTQCNEKGLHYECRLVNMVNGTFFGDETKLREMLLNIMSNAIKFTDAPGDIILTVEKIAEYEDRSTLRFDIRDTGIGMDKDYIPKLFEAFSQENAEDKTKYASTGLGMAITKRIVEMMNGSINVKSEKGIGTEFEVVLSLGNANSKNVNHTNAIDPANFYILVVDDDPIEAEHARIVLEEIGIAADTCTSGQEALRKMEVQHAKYRPYNMVLMDWNMPGMSGPETSAEINRMYSEESIVVALTAYNWDDIQAEANNVGVNGFLPKPLFTTNLLDNIENIARRSKLDIFTEKNRVKLSGRRILLAEDMELNAEIIMDILEMEDIKADHAENGKIAIDLFKNSTVGIYSAIIMDVRMPEMDGLEATRIIRSMDREDAKQIPIIALSANAFDEDAKLSIQAGMNAHLTKPVEADNLIRVLGELLYDAGAR